MDKINFENLPSTNTPLDADTLNGMQSNIEKSVVAVSTTQPSTNEKVWIKTGKNHFKSENVIRLTNCTYSNGVVTQIEVDTATNVRFALQSFMNTNFIANLEVKDVQVGKTTFTFVKDNSFNQIQFGASGTSIDTKILVDVQELEDGQTYTLSFDLTNITQGSISWRDIQIEQGTTASELEPYVSKEILVKNNNGVFERFADIDEIENSIFDTGWIPIQFTSNDWKAREGSAMYAPKFRKIGNVVFLQGQFATNQILNPGTYNIVTTNLPEPDKQHTICTCAYTGKLVNMWIVGKTISLRVFDNNFNDAIGVSIDSCYIAY